MVFGKPRYCSRGAWRRGFRSAADVRWIQICADTTAGWTLRRRQQQTLVGLVDKIPCDWATPLELRRENCETAQRVDRARNASGVDSDLLDRICRKQRLVTAVHAVQALAYERCDLRRW